MRNSASLLKRAAGNVRRKFKVVAPHIREHLFTEFDLNLVRRLSLGLVFYGYHRALLTRLDAIAQSRADTLAEVDDVAGLEFSHGFP